MIHRAGPFPGKDFTGDWDGRRTFFGRRTAIGYRVYSGADRDDDRTGNSNLSTEGMIPG